MTKLLRNPSGVVVEVYNEQVEDLLKKGFTLANDTDLETAASQQEAIDAVVQEEQLNLSKNEAARLKTANQTLADEITALRDKMQAAEAMVAESGAKIEQANLETNQFRAATEKAEQAALAAQASKVAEVAEYKAALQTAQQKIVDLEAKVANFEKPKK